jgi:hypothetical protein
MKMMHKKWNYCNDFSFVRKWTSSDENSVKEMKLIQWLLFFQRNWNNEMKMMQKKWNYCNDFSFVRKWTSSDENSVKKMKLM